MGPIIVFDKSFMQSLSVDESVWFDHFFVANVCPLFWVETLADLAKAAHSGSTPEQEVARIADKFPDLGGTPNAYHRGIILSELMGAAIPITGQILVVGGHTHKQKEFTRTAFDQFPEASAFMRWQNRSFMELERSFASVWRRDLENLDLEDLVHSAPEVLNKGAACRNLEEAKDLADMFVNDSSQASRHIDLLLRLLSYSDAEKATIRSRWETSGCPPLAEYSPYAAFVLRVELFFRAALSGGVIATTRPSNRTDIAYLYYLPFCMVFVSSDKLHRRCAPLFLRPNQDFVWGPDLKADLRQINGHFWAFPDEDKAKGIMAFACRPPDDSITADLWDRHLAKGWRKRPKPTDQMNPEALAKFVSLAQGAIKGNGDLSDKQPEHDPDLMVFRRVVRRRKGSWHQVPSPDADKENEDTGAPS